MMWLVLLLVSANALSENITSCQSGGQAECAGDVETDELPLLQVESLAHHMDKQVDVEDSGAMFSPSEWAKACGFDTGIFVKISEDSSFATAVIKGKEKKKTRQQSDFGRKDLIDWMVLLLTERGYSLNSITKEVRQILDVLGYVARDFDSEMQMSTASHEVDKSYELSSGHVVTLGTERFQSFEALLKPSYAGKEALGLGDLISNSAWKADLKDRQYLLRNIILVGYAGSIRGLDERLVKELVAEMPSSYHIKVRTCEKRMKLASGSKESAPH